MGRGRAKAKQTKVARELKYHTPSTDLDALRRELTNGEDAVPGSVDGGATPAADDDEYDDYGEDRWASSR